MKCIALPESSHQGETAAMLSVAPAEETLCCSMEEIILR